MLRRSDLYYEAKKVTKEYIHWHPSTVFNGLRRYNEQQIKELNHRDSIKLHHLLVQRIEGWEIAEDWTEMQSYVNDFQERNDVALLKKLSKGVDNAS